MTWPSWIGFWLLPKTSMKSEPGDTMEITAIQAHVLSTEKLADGDRYEDTAGLRFP
jgi:hypothetical protein